MARNRKYRIDHCLAAIMLGTMALIAFINVISRFFFHFSFASTEEITINLFVWLTVVGTGLAFERGGQLGMVTLYNHLPPSVQKWVVILSASLAFMLFLLVDVYMIQAIYDEITLFQATSAGLGIPVWIYYAGVPVLSVFVFRGIIRDAGNRLRSLKEPDH
ncbi:MAG: TRAP transporter small permease [Desulfovermiculus sp.]|nr:TRAP transporter small permease [Desulfovermiculus sp.]